MKESRYFQLDEDTARQIARVFKERVYGIQPDESPEELLTAIAEREFGLVHAQLPPAASPIVQRLDSPLPGQVRRIATTKPPAERANVAAALQAFDSQSNG